MLSPYSATKPDSSAHSHYVRSLQSMPPRIVAYVSVVTKVCITSIYPEAINIYGNSFEVDKSARSELITAVWDFTLCHWAKASSVSKDRIAFDTPGSV